MAILEPTMVSTLLEWYDQKTLTPNPDFQRRDVWPPQAKSYFIDSVIRGRPTPNIYIRSKVNLKTRKVVREVVDGQQRIRTLHEFADNRLVLDKRSEEYEGLRYDRLDDDAKEAFLSYSIGVVQLFNADDEEVIDIFRRLNSYSLPVNAQELRHAKYVNQFSWAIEACALRWAVLWEKYKVVTLRQRVRMADDQLVAEIYGIIINGVTDGGQTRIEKLYEDCKIEFPVDTVSKVDQVIEYVVTNLSEILNTSLARSPQFLILFAAVTHALLGIPQGEIEKDRKTVMPARDARALSDKDKAIDNLKVLANVIDQDPRDVDARFAPFKSAAGGTTQRILSRRIRFLTLYKALFPELI